MQEKLIKKIETIGIVVAVFFLAGEALWSAYINSGLLSSNQRQALFISSVLMILLMIFRRLYTISAVPKASSQTLEDFSSGISLLINNKSKVSSLDIYCLESDSYFEQLFAARNVEVDYVRIILPSNACIENFYKDSGHYIVNSPLEAENNLKSDIKIT